jgi:ABC-type nitrate/sulfonate/bicarbonate transport system ATPase subunit
MIAIDQVSKEFETKGGRRHLAIADIALAVADGEFVSILGPSGCGKSTLLYIVGGFVPPSTGAVTVGGAIARTLAYRPSILLMDEPFGALDAHTRTRLQNDLTEIWERDRKTVLFVTHSVEEAVFLSDRVVVMTRSPGRIKEIVPIDLARPRDRATLLLDRRYQDYVVRIERMMDSQE